MVLLVLLALLSAVLIAGRGTADETQRTAASRLIRYLRSDGGQRGGTIFGRADRYLLQLPLGDALERYLDQAGVTAPASGWLMGAAAGACAAAGIASALGGPSLGVLALTAAVFGARVVLQTARGRRLRRIETQMPGALELLVGQLRAHRSIGEAVSDAARWLPGPLGAECMRVAEELRIGTSLPRALERLRDRVPVPGVAAIATAIVVAERTGANLVETLDRQAAAARSRIAFHHEVSAMTAHARTTGATLTLLPLGVAAAMQLLDPAVFAPMTGTTPGRILLGTAGVMELLGWYVIRWMIRRVEA